VFGFIKRVELAKVSETNRHIHQICWPRLHGNRVMAHEVGRMIISPQCEFVRSLMSLKAIMLGEVYGGKVPLADCPPPDYIIRFSSIQIKYVNA
jgi:hypothetical protein